MILCQQESIPNGIIPWGLSVNRVLEDGRLMFKQVKESEATPIVTFLIQGEKSFFFRLKAFPENVPILLPFSVYGHEI